MRLLHYHGLPVTPLDRLYELAGRHFCVSYAWPDQVVRAHQLGQSVMLDNGAYSFWQSRKPVNWAGFMAWADEWLDYPTTWAVIPDVIGGSEEDNDKLLVSWFQWRLPKGAPVWHLHESFERLRRLAHGYERVCFGSSGRYARVGDDEWRRRVSAAFDVIADERGRVPWVHMLRGMKLSGDVFPFASVDSTDIGRNHNREQNTPRGMADRWDGLQCPARWRPVGTQTELEVA